jgi:uncharacterized protein with HEPN domain
MLQAAREIVEITHDLDRGQFLQSTLVLRATERDLEILGEAARGVSETVRNEHPEIPWRGLVGRRNVLTHEYGNIDYDLL